MKLLFISIGAIFLLLFLLRKKDSFSTSFDNPKHEDNSKRPRKYEKGYKTQRRLNYERNRDAAITWLANFFQVENTQLVKLLKQPQYTVFCIRKRSGGFRTIHAPSSELLKIQRSINQKILANVNLHPSCIGYKKEKSVIDNARPHLGKPYILKLDLYNFFPSIPRTRVRRLFMDIGYPTNIANQLSHLCCYKGKLPQGAATSPALSNLIAKELDEMLSKIAVDNNLIYTRYADDLTFSSDFIDFLSIKPIIYNTIIKNRFYPNISKTRQIRPNYRKIITGVSVSNGDKMTIPRAKKRELRQAIYHIKTKGLDAHLAKLGIQDYYYQKRILGYLNFWKHIEPENEFVISSITFLKSLK